MTRSSDEAAGLPSWATFWIWVAVLLMLTTISLLAPNREWHTRVLNSEQGIIENLTVLLSLTAAVLAVCAWVRRRDFPGKWLGLWFLLCALVFVGYAGEETSWGQHWFGWSSPEFFAEENRQAETNLHNLGKHVTQRWPKLLLTLGIVVGGGLVPWSLRRRGIRLSPESGRYWWLPERDCFPLVGLIVFTRLLERIKTWGDLDDALVWRIELKETNEMLITAFFVIYVWSVLRRLRLAPDLR